MEFGKLSWVHGCCIKAGLCIHQRKIAVIFFPNDCTLGSLASCVLEMENSWNIPTGWGSRGGKLCNHVLRLGLWWSCLIPILDIARHPQMIIFNEMSLPPLTVLFKFSDHHTHNSHLGCLLDTYSPEPYPYDSDLTGQSWKLRRYTVNRDPRAFCAAHL